MTEPAPPPAPVVLPGAIMPLAHAIYALSMAIQELAPVAPIGADIRKHVAAAHKALGPLFGPDGRFVDLDAEEKPLPEATPADDPRQTPTERTEQQVRDELARLDRDERQHREALANIEARRAELDALTRPVAGK